LATLARPILEKCGKSKNGIFPRQKRFFFYSEDSSSAEKNYPYSAIVSAAGSAIFYELSRAAHSQN
jgi:hypothetical protein